MTATNYLVKYRIKGGSASFHMLVLESSAEKARVVAQDMLHGLKGYVTALPCERAGHPLPLLVRFTGETELEIHSVELFR